MRLITLLSLLVLGACQPPRAEVNTAVCFAGESSAGTTDAMGQACPLVESAVSYSMLGPNVKLLVDKSGSMGGTKWDEVQSLIPYLPAVTDRANVGLSVFPAPNRQCEVDGNEIVAVTDGVTAAEDISAALTSLTPYGSTPMAAALRELRTDPGIACTNRDNIVVLLSDGEETCDGDAPAEARRLTQGPVPVELFVIGFGTTTTTDNELRSIAAAAEPTTGPDNFYTASTVGELLERLYTVTATCTAQLDNAVDSERLLVSLDGEELMPCTEERCDSGYTYDIDHATVKLQGSDCLALQDGQCHDLTFDTL